MKRRDLVSHLLANGCVLVREGSKHSLWANPAKNLATAIPRHGEIDNNTAKGICRQLDVPPTKKK